MLSYSMIHDKTVFISIIMTKKKISMIISVLWFTFWRVTLSLKLFWLTYSYDGYNNINDKILIKYIISRE